MTEPVLLYEIKPSGDGRINVATWVRYPDGRETVADTETVDTEDQAVQWARHQAKVSGGIPAKRVPAA